MSYDQKQVSRYDFSGVDLTTSDKVRLIRAPKGKKGKIINFGAMTTTTVAASTTAPTIEVGTSGTANAYGALTLSKTQAAGTLADCVSTPAALTSATIPASTTDAGRLIQVTATHGVDASSAAGVADIFIEIEWR